MTRRWALLKRKKNPTIGPQVMITKNITGLASPLAATLYPLHEGILLFVH